MRDPANTARVIASADLREYFRESVGDALIRQGVDATFETLSYVVNLLAGFLRSERLFDVDGDRSELRPLARLYIDALEGRSAEERCRVMQRMGDVALFISGVFPESFPRRVIDVDYYIAMGSNAYGYLSDAMRGTARGDTFCGIFEELSGNFTRFADALSELSEQSPPVNDADIFRQYELWFRTGSRRALERLRKSGIEPGVSGTSMPGRADH